MKATTAPYVWKAMVLLILIVLLVVLQPDSLQLLPALLQGPLPTDCNWPLGYMFNHCNKGKN